MRRMAAPLLATCIALTACSIGPVTTGPKDVVTPAEATQAVKAALAINQRREIPKRDNALGSQYEVGSALAVDAAENTTADVNGTPQIKSLVSRDIQVFVPHQTQYPALFLAEFTFDGVDGAGKQSSSHQVYLFARDASSGWHVAAFASAGTALAPKPTMGSDGYATRGTHAAEAAARTYADYRTRGAAGKDVSGAGFAPGLWTDQGVARDLQPVINVTSVFTYAVKDVAPGVPIASFALDGGASLVLTAMAMQEIGTYRPGFCDKVLKNNVPGLPPEGSYSKETALGESMLAITVPKAAKGMSVIGEGAYESATGVGGC